MKKDSIQMIGRCQLLGDMICAHPIAKYYKRLYPNSRLIWPIAKKVSQGAPLYINNPYIDEIFVFDGQEGPESERDWNKIESCDIVINPNPEHPDNRYPSEFNIYSETWRMAGLLIEEWDKLTPEQQRPNLIKWWNNDIVAPAKTIAYWPNAGYGVENKRNASWQWCNNLVKRLISEGYNVWQFGSSKDYVFDIWESDKFRTFKKLSFFEQIKLSLTTDLMIGTCSGSALIIGAYKHPQISLLTDHWGNTNNPMALSSNNSNNISLFGSGSADNITIDSVIEAIKSF